LRGRVGRADKEAFAYLFYPDKSLLTDQALVRARRTSHDRRPAQGRAVAVQGQYLQRCSSSSVV
ncbi:hypothetical protein Taro_006783, partial [Colocasia esculenta]|nr:hypothetical protein [Colocasia esculenta]